MKNDTNSLWERLAAGDEDARQQLLNEHLGLVYFVARQISSGVAKYVEFDELVSAGSLGAAFDIQYAVNPNSVLLARARADGLTRAAIFLVATINPDAAASLREGLEETLTVVRLGVSAALRRTLSTTNPIESALSVTRRVTARVTRWRDGDMRKRWCAAGLLRAESKFRRLKGRRAMPTLLKALESLVRERRGGSKQDVA